MSNTIAYMAAASIGSMRTIDISRFLLALSIFLFSSGLQGQSGTATGTVVIEEDGKQIGLPGASVIWSGTNQGTTTDQKGRFKLALSTESDSLSISFIGYQTVRMKYEGPFILALELGVQLKGVDIISKESSTALFLLDPLNIQRLDNTELRKAACCNLSESFETNASVDASFTDALTGTRQIRMLGLSGRYSQIMKDNIPNIRGLTTIYGLGYIPGDWIDNIYISKGAGSVTSGFESITGEINVALKDAQTEEKAHFNLYANEGGRTEFNTNVKHKVSDTWSTILLGHAEVNENEMDRNGDGFMDNPLQRDIVLRNQWMFRSKGSWEGQYAINYLDQHQKSGEMDFNAERTPELWGIHMDAERLEASAKTGYLLDDAWNSSFGSQFSVDRYNSSIQAGTQTFMGKQETYRANLLYATKLGCAKKGMTVGLTALAENYETRLDSLVMDREERVFGAYAEFTWNPSERLSSIIGLRADEHNLFGTMISPRLHVRYSLSESISLKGALGRGYRTANPVMDNLGYLASNREWTIEAPLVQESGWNTGLNLTYKFKLDYREASLAMDAYRTQFDSFSVVDIETPGQVNIYSLEGESYANTAQVEFAWEMLRRTNVRLAYRYTQAEVDYRIGRRLQPFNPENRGFLNLSYETKATENTAQWKVDGTLQFIGKQRIPSSFSMSEEDQQSNISSYSEAFFQAHGQVSRIFKKGLEAYLGVENGGNYRQNNPIQSASAPFDPSFDASQIWAPIFGRMTYLGLRWTIY